MRRWSRLAGLALLSLASAGRAEAPALRLAAAPVLQDSGLLGALLPAFTRSQGLAVRVLPARADQAVELALRGEADVLLTDAPESAELVEAGQVFARRLVLRSDLVIVGPFADPAGVRGAARATVAFVQIANERSAFLSGGPESETLPYEERVWSQAGRDPSAGAGGWYRTLPAGRALLDFAGESRAYALVERARWLAQKDRRVLDLLVEGDPGLALSYEVLVVASLKHPGVRSVEGERLAQWLAGAGARAAIEAFRIGGKPAFSAPAP